MAVTLRPAAVCGSLLLVALLLPWTAAAQQSGVALPERVPGATIPAGAKPAAAPAPAAPAPAAPTAPAAATAPAAPREIPVANPPPSAPAPREPLAAKGQAPANSSIMLNFQGTPIADVLNYLSEAAGFVIVQETPVTGTVNVVSRQPVNAEEAVDLLNTVLFEKGFTALRSGRILKIVSRKEAQKRDLPVKTGSDPQKIPKRDDMVTQIMPLRYGEAAKLVENLKPLLSESSTINANEGSNSILLTDTQANINRIAEIISAIDTSVASISTIHVYPLQFANAKDLATIVTQLFASGSANNNNTQQNPFGGMGGGRGGFGGFGFPGAAPQPAASNSEARRAAARIIAVADDQSNSLIVSAPEDMIPTITEMVKKIDTSIADVTENRIFRLTHADSVETAALITQLFSDNDSQNAQRNQNPYARQGYGGYGYSPYGMPAAQASSQSQHALLQSKVVAVGDPRTNSLLISAARDTMLQIAEMVGRLDATDAKKQRVYVHSLEHADAESVAAVLRGMLGGQGANSGQSQSASSRLTDRSANGAAINPADATSTNRSSR